MSLSLGRVRLDGTILAENADVVFARLDALLLLRLTIRIRTRVQLDAVDRSVRTTVHAVAPFLE